MANTPSPLPSSDAVPEVQQTVRTDVGAAKDRTSPPQISVGSAATTLFLQPEVGSVIGVYRLDQKLGEGGMGAVWKAFHVRLEKYVALKTLPVAFTRDPNLVARFDREMKAVGKVDHPNVVRAMDAGEFQGVHYLVMEYVDGTDLGAFLRDRGPQSVRQACELVRQAAHGLAAAHKLGLVHRDIKPANLFLTMPKEGSPSIVKILDLGLARLAEESGPTAQTGLTGAGAVMGTPDYMAPEQWENSHTVDGRADLYALGCTLFCLLTGRPPYGDDAHASLPKKIVGHTTEPIPDLRAARQASVRRQPDDTSDEIPDALNTLYQRLMAKEPADRIPTADELASQLQNVLDSQEASVGRQPHDSASPAQHPASAKSDTHGADAPRSPGDGRAPQKTRAGTNADAGLPKASSSGGAIPKSRLTLAAGGAAALLLLAVILITIKNKDGTTTEIKVPEGSTVEIATDSSSSGLRPSTINPQPAGWHGWPADAPKPAIAPFDAAQAKRHQEAWAAYLKIPVEHTNSLGMKFVLIPPGEFTMGSTPEEIEAALKDAGDDKHWQECIKSEAPQHKVILTQPIYLGVNEVTQAEYEKGMGANPSHFSPMGKGKEAVANLETGSHPVEMVSWNDAAEFCAKLSQQEKLKPFYFRAGETITPLDGTGYRLPSEAEWEFACRAGTTTKFWIGDRDDELMKAAWFNGNSGGRTHAAGELKANPFGLFDIHGNVWEWVQDGWDASYYGEFPEKSAINPNSPFRAGSQRVIRGGSWHIGAFPPCRSSTRYAYYPADRNNGIGFRLSLTVESVRQAIQRSASKNTSTAGWHGWPADAPMPAIAPFDAAQAKRHQEAWAAYLKIPVEYTNSIGMKFRLIPPGEFTMGSTQEEIDEAVPEAGKNQVSREKIQSEAPQHRVVLTQPTYLGVFEVTQAEYEKVMGMNPSHHSAKGPGSDKVAGIDTAQHPVEMVSWNDAAEFCATLSTQEKRKPFYVQVGDTISLLAGTGYRLPTEAEWEFACRAGTTTRFWSGDGDQELYLAGWCGANSGGRTHAAGELKVNPFGIYDVHGNVWEWVQDGWDKVFYEKYKGVAAIDPSGPSTPFPAPYSPIIRGGAFGHRPYGCRSSHRDAIHKGYRDIGFGFRLTLPIDAVKQALTAQATVDTAALTNWHGWQPDAPKPAIAPFDAALAKKHQEEWAAYLKVPVEYTNSIGMKFRLIPPGEFTMGSTPEEIEAALKFDNDMRWQKHVKSEAPQHTVILTQPIYLGVNEVAQAEYEKVMGKNPSFFAKTGPERQYVEKVDGLDTSAHPVENVSWNDAAEFCDKLSQQEKLKPFYFRAGETVTPLEGTGYRLPTEAEWEFACRAGTTTKYWIGDTYYDLVKAGWFHNNSGGRTHPAGELKANPFGLFDIHGNVWEWVQDGWEAAFYGQFSGKLAINPSGPFSAGLQCGVRGGSWRYNASYCRSSYRHANVPTYLYSDVGFRVSLVAVGPRVGR